jgi:hypothetical protein
VLRATLREVETVKYVTHYNDRLNRWGVQQAKTQDEHERGSRSLSATVTEADRLNAQAKGVTPKGVTPKETLP